MINISRKKLICKIQIRISRTDWEIISVIGIILANMNNFAY